MTSVISVAVAIKSPFYFSSVWPGNMLCWDQLTVDACLRPTHKLITHKRNTVNHVEHFWYECCLGVSWNWERLRQSTIDVSRFESLARNRIVAVRLRIGREWERRSECKQRYLWDVWMRQTIRLPRRTRRANGSWWRASGFMSLQWPFITGEWHWWPFP